MNSKKEITSVLEQLKLNPEQHHLTPRQIDKINEAIALLNEIDPRSDRKNDTQSLLNIAQFFRLLMELLGGNSS